MPPDYDQEEICLDESCLREAMALFVQVRNNYSMTGEVAYSNKNLTYLNEELCCPIEAAEQVCLAAFSSGNYAGQSYLRLIFGAQLLWSIYAKPAHSDCIKF